VNTTDQAKGSIKKSTFFLLGIGACIVSFGAFLAAQAFWFVPRSLTVRETEITSPKWQGPPVRIALLADIHGDNFHMPIARIKSLAVSVAALKPDIVLLGGDYTGGHFKKSSPPGAQMENRSDAENAFEREIILALGELRAPLGVFAIMGNHDCWWNCGEVRRLFARTKVTFLENQAVQVARPSGAFWVVGIEDGQTQAPDFIAANQNVPPNSDVLTLVHNPGLFRWPTNQAAFQFSGHSHGGQVRFPVIGAPVRMSRYTEETVDQPYIQDGRVLTVSTGLGEIGLPVRFGVPPEIVLVTVSNGNEVRAVAQKRKPL
jgi:uncharacterized protein